MLPVYNQQREDLSIKQSRCEIKSIHQWFEKNRLPERIFNLNPKHGENGKGNIPGESILLCSKEKAQCLLHKAVGDSSNPTLFYYDEEYGRYMEFKNENTGNNTYHAFHIENNILCHRLKKSIKEKIDYVFPDFKDKG
jgi:hypothetical protein